MKQESKKELKQKSKQELKQQPKQKAKQGIKQQPKQESKQESKQVFMQESEQEEFRIHRSDSSCKGAESRCRPSAAAGGDRNRSADPCRGFYPHGGDGLRFCAGRRQKDL